MKLKLPFVIVFLILSALVGYMIGRTTCPLTTAIRQAKNLSNKGTAEKKKALAILDEQKVAIELALKKAHIEESRKILALSLAEIMMKHEMWLEAEKYLKVVIAILPADFKANYNFGVVYSSLYNIEKDSAKKRKLHNDAIGYFGVALKANPKNGDANYLMGILLYKDGRSAEALDYFNTVLRRFPKDVNCLLSVARIYYDQGENEKARKIYLKLENILPPKHPKLAVIRKNLETLHRGLGNE